MNTEVWVALATLTAMEIVLGIDNIIFLAIVAGRLPKDQQPAARKIGLALALLTRLALLFTLTFLMQLKDTVVVDFAAIGIPDSWFEDKETRIISVKDLVLIVGGAFLIAKSTMEIHHKLEGSEEEHGTGKVATSLTATVIQIALIDIVFSLDSVITAVGMVSDLWVMVAAMILAMLVMLAFSGRVSDFVARHPTVKILALSFLILIGVMLVAEGFGQHISKGYIYFAMAFSVVVEFLNLRLKSKTPPVKLHEKQMPKTDG